MSASYLASGVFIGIIASNVNATEPAWGVFIIPAAIAFAIGLVIQNTESRG